ncbi:MAG: SEC-C metal-binding domain-containing protein [Verrucomicrobiota bacterium]|nr:SEC-C metal-binding domain-containing protein [Verrucomicrobiota bacterium]
MHGNKELYEKLGRNDLCPCGSQVSFKNCCMQSGNYDGSLRNYFFPRIVGYMRVHVWHPELFTAGCGRDTLLASREL